MDNNYTNPPSSSQVFEDDKRDLPNANAVLILGIISIASCFCSGLPGTICGIIALILASKDKQLLNANPLNYNQNSVKNLENGRICAIIGLCISGLMIIGVIIYIFFMGTLMTSVPWQNIN